MLDNGTEFEEYQRLIDKNVEVFFADPYCSNQRAINENKPFARSASVYRYDKQDCEAIKAKFQRA